VAGLYGATNSYYHGDKTFNNQRIWWGLVASKEDGLSMFQKKTLVEHCRMLDLIASSVAGAELLVA
jgi:hypothetical protein